MKNNRKNEDIIKFRKKNIINDEWTMKFQREKFVIVRFSIELDSERYENLLAYLQS